MVKGLYEVFAEKWLRGGSVWIYSDPHFADDEMKYLRKNYIGDEEQLKRINSKLGKNDTIIFLGDIGNTSFISKIKGYKVLIMGNHEKGASNYKRSIKEVKFPFVCSEEEYEKIQKEYGEIFGPADMYGLAKKQVEYAESVIKTDFEKRKVKDGTLKRDTVKGRIDTIEKSYDEKTDKWYYHVIIDNHLFDEVYEGPLMVSDRLLLSHEPIELPSFMFNIHGHDHSNWCKLKNHMNVCAEHINYTPVNLMNLLKNGLLKDVDDIHRVTIDGANKKKAKKEGKRNAN